MQHDVFTYIIEAGRNLKINTPGITDFSQIKTQAEQRADCGFYAVRLSQRMAH